MGLAEVAGGGPEAMRDSGHTWHVSLHFTIISQLCTYIFICIYILNIAFCLYSLLFHFSQ